MRLQLCTSISEVAGKIMEARQEGVSMAALAALPPSDDEAVRNLRKALLIAAYDSPRYSSDEYQRKAVEDFKNDAFLGCFKAGEDTNG